ncbi:unnamed protein product [Owenia fusiformis]|uniref:MRG-binding protein n=1 Tax=Owenia fusiformis TaxID=6347 RepID=A0A8S4N0R9_OWEFU|nr:unnamed protein product [Owenia fusiformis]
MGEENFVKWDVDLEVALFHAMRNHKPVGVNRHFHMACLQQKLNAAVNKKLTTKQIWTHLNTMYALQSLNDSEKLPFKNKESEFTLPEADFSELMEKKLPKKISESGSQSEDSPVSTPVSKQTSKNTEQKLSIFEKLDPPDSPKRAERKRTRHGISSPNTSGTDTPSSTKRPRRT